MDLEYDPAKRETNLSKHGVDFESVHDFDFDSALYWVDDRFSYGEVRYVAIGYLAERLHVICFTETETGIRVISLRKANKREVKKYEGRERSGD
ncbi:BrnT family toxin [Pseudomonas aeruginosa]|uniref:BrnT family toxin n=1 Tax=Pseudomonas aeruginosa TaxID=287 RepID=UPI00053E7AB2|nr:BrnT family toxin [Pseudomonas aeruginosa]EKZ3178507.1 BrnT family toxin [Pseudomonas aeruginosa]EMC2521298.1 BrnT family toxin [Pseudomonas aeruginosa]MBG4755113.1 BrnT family toxin [Pseudomonas aeruginosa]MBG6401951.1 BrnT family toxin [Pseudomonas aeruginosa]MBG6851211.1 BrnT family toxin [Pseudomonas aeruginosa]